MKLHIPIIEKSLRQITEEFFPEEVLMIPIKNGEEWDYIKITKPEIAEYLYQNAISQVVKKSDLEYEEPYLEDKIETLKNRALWSGWRESHENPNKEIAVIYWFYYVRYSSDDLKLSAYRIGTELDKNSSEEDKKAELIKLFDKGMEGLRVIIEKGIYENGSDKRPFLELLPSSIKGDDLLKYEQ